MAEVDEDAPDMEAAYWRMMEAGEKARKVRQSSLAIGCLAPAVLLALALLIAIAGH